MGHDVTIELDDALMEDFKRAAADSGRSLEAELRDALLRVRPKRRMSRDELAALSERLRANTPASARAIDSTLLIREDRDSR
jgi:antitoxin component of MazEF toxin-antitoxin module